MERTILGISPGTRILGLGVLRNGELVEWQVKTFKGAWTRDKRIHIVQTISNLCHHFEITDIALKVVSPLRSSKNLALLTHSIVVASKREGIAISKYSIHDLKLKTGHSKGLNRNDFMEGIVEKFPALKCEYMRERNNLNPYYLKMFEAIAAGYLADKET